MILKRRSLLIVDSNATKLYYNQYTCIYASMFWAKDSESFTAWLFVRPFSLKDERVKKKLELLHNQTQRSMVV